MTYESQQPLSKPSFPPLPVPIHLPNFLWAPSTSNMLPTSQQNNGPPYISSLWKKTFINQG